MENRYNKGQFRRQPDGIKTPKMLAVEKTLDQTLEEDFQEYYIRKNWGQKKLANRWGMKKAQIFDDHMPGGRRCWAPGRAEDKRR